MAPGVVVRICLGLDEPRLGRRAARALRSTADGERVGLAAISLKEAAWLLARGRVKPVAKGASWASRNVRRWRERLSSRECRSLGSARASGRRAARATSRRPGLCSRATRAMKARVHISLKPGETNNAFIAWYQPTAAPYNPSPLLYRDYFYVLFDFGFLACHDARTGQPIYDKQRIRPEPTSFTASPWAANGKIFALSEDGDTFVFQAGPEFRLLHKNPLDEMCMATPAMAGDRLLIRTLTKLYCFSKTR